MSKKTSILFVMPKFGSGGAEKSLLMLLYNLSKRDDVEISVQFFKREGIFLSQLPPNVHIVDNDDTLTAAYSSFSIKNIKSLRSFCISIVRPFATVICKLISNSYNNRSQLRWRYCYSKLIKKNPVKYDYACGYLDGEAVYYVVDKVNATKKIGWNHNDYRKIGFSPKFDNMYFSKLDNIASISDECLEVLKGFFPDNAHKMLNIPNVVSAGMIRQQANQDVPGDIEQSDFTLVSIGRLVDQKGFDMAIDASAIMKKSGRNFRWYIIGVGELELELKEQCVRKGVQDVFIFLGERSNPHPYIKAATIFVQPSRMEGKSVVLNEAKIIGKPIVATNYATVYEQLKDRETGCICEMNADSIAREIMNLVDDKELQKHLQENLEKEQFEDNFGIVAVENLFNLTHGGIV